MSKTELMLLAALRSALCGKCVDWEDDISPEQWSSLFGLSCEHHVFPLIFEAVHCCKAAKSIPQQLFSRLKRQTIEQVTLQTMKTAEFLSLYEFLSQKGIKPLIVKGIVCRSLYPKPDHRISCDEDMFISPGDFDACRRALVEYGLKPVNAKKDVASQFEVTYMDKKGLLCVELHRLLFSPDSVAYGDFNGFFTDAFDNSIEESFGGVAVRQMNPTDHLFYLICHSFKHFLHGGFGIRQVCDIALYANAHGKDIDWSYIYDNCRKIKADLFAAAIFKIGEMHLTFSPNDACYPDFWREISVDETMLLEDLLSSGVYGGSTMSRKHSSTLTLEAVAAQKRGRAVKRANPIKSAFPSAKQLCGRYPYLKRLPFLLPIAWADRLIRYRTEIKAGGNNSAARSVRIANERIRLMKQYGIIE